VGCPQLLARFDASAFAAEPLAVEEMSTGELRTKFSTTQTVNRLAIEVVRVGALAEQRPGAGLDPEREVVAAGLRALRQPLERVACKEPGDDRVGVPHLAGGSAPSRRRSGRATTRNSRSSTMLRSEMSARSVSPDLR
jgi:hypothetical protein